MPRFFPLLALLLLPALARADMDYGAVPDFHLTERSGRTIGRDDLRGHVWLASFVFTRCTGPCPQVTLTLKRLQDELARYPDVRLVTFTVDPEHDDPQELRHYAEHFGADSERWLFLTGKEKEIYGLLRTGFHIYVEPTTGDERKPGREVAHDTRLFVVDRQGHLRGSYEGLRDSRWPDPEQEYERSLRKLRQEVVALEYEAWYLPSDFPCFNAILNGVCTALLLLGYQAIRLRLLRLHVASMLSAFGVSVLFLTSYLFYHLVIKQGHPTSFAEQTSAAHPPPWAAPLYLAVLLTHTVLAVLVPFLALGTIYLALRRRWLRHVQLARWTFPIWLYVSITGVVVYYMLYRLYPSS